MNKLNNTITYLLIVFSIFLVSESYAQIELDPVNDVGVTAKIDPDPAPQGGNSSLKVVIQLPSDVHISDREMGFFFLSIGEVEGLSWGLPSYPSGIEFEGETVYRGVVEIIYPFTVDGELGVGQQIEVSGTLGYQICTENDPIYCTPPIERDISAVTVVGKPVKGNVPTTTTGAASDGSIESKALSALESGSLIALIWIFLGGMALSLTPCVYPIIPITIAFIGAKSDGSRLKGFTLSLVFVLGLALVYSTLGVIAAASGGVFGLSTQNPVIIVLVTVVFLVMGIGMLGAFEINLPSSWQTKMSSHGKSGYVGALLVGATTGLVAAPCVGPVLIALLGWVSSSGNLFTGFLYLFVFACGLGSLFVLLGTFAGAITALPTAGGWMENVKKVFGVILIGMAFFFGRPLIPDTWFTLGIGLATLMLAGLLGGFSLLSADSSMGQKVSRGLGSFILLLGAFYTLYGIAKFEGVNLAGIGAGAGGQVLAGDVSQKNHEGPNWIKDDFEAAFERASSTGDIIMIDFWADWCAACKEMDHKTFAKAEVYEIINEHFVPLKIDGTKVTKEMKAIWDKYDVRGLPTILFLTPEGEEVNRFEAFRTVNQVVPILNELKNN